MSTAVTKPPMYLRSLSNLTSPISVGENIQVESDGGTIVCVDSDEIGDHDPDQADAALRYSFDHVFDAGTSTTDLYQARIRPMLDSFLSGINGTIMTYGQTGSGKTFTLTGTASCPGVSVMLVQDLLQRVQLADAATNSSSQLMISYVEIYNEEVYDLLASKAHKGESLRVRENSDGVFIEGLNKKNVCSTEEIHALLRRGAQNRSVAATVWNHESSRSHSILSMELELYTRQHQDDTEIKRRSVLNVVDLAGSERIAKYSTDKSVDALVRQKEGGNINKSLYSLASVVSHLAQGSHHIPYRNSRLTRILQPSLGGNSRTLICVCVSAAKHNIHETISSLKFAALAKTIHNEYSVNVSTTTRPAASNSGTRIKERASESSLSPALNTTDPILPSSGQQDVALQLERSFQERAQIQLDHDHLKTNVHFALDVMRDLTRGLQNGIETDIDLDHAAVLDHARPVLAQFVATCNQYIADRCRANRGNDQLQRACTMLLQHAAVLQERLGSQHDIVDDCRYRISDHEGECAAAASSESGLDRKRHHQLCCSDRVVIERYDDLVTALQDLISHLHDRFALEHTALMHGVHNLVQGVDLEHVLHHAQLMEREFELVRSEAKLGGGGADSELAVTPIASRLLEAHRQWEEEIGCYRAADSSKDQCISNLYHDGQRLKIQLAQLQSTFRTQCDQIRDKRDRYARQCIMLQNANAELELAISKQKVVIASINDAHLVETERSAQKVAHLDQQLTAAQQRLEDVQRSESDLRSQLQKAAEHEQQQIESIRSETVRMQRLVQECGKREAQLERDRAQDRDVIESLRQAKSELKRGLAGAQQHQNELEKQNQALTESEAACRTELQQQQRAAAEQIGALDDQVRLLRDQIQLGLDLEHDLRQQNQEQRDQLDAVSNREHDLQHKLQSADELEYVRRCERDQLQAQLAASQQQCQQHADQCRTAHTQLQAVLAGADLERDRLRHEHQEIIRNLSAEHDAARCEHNRHVQGLDNRIAELQSKCRLLEVRNDEIEIEFDAVRDRFHLQTQQLDDVQDQLQRSKAQRSEMALEQRVQALLDEKTSLTADHDREKAELCDQLQHALAQVASEAQHAAELIDDLGKERLIVNELERCKEQAEIQIVDRYRQIELFQVRIRELERRLEQVQSDDHDHIVKQQAQIQDLKQRYQQMYRDLSQLHLDRNQLSADHERICTELQDVMRSRDQLQTALNSKEQELVESVRRLAQLQTQIEAMSAQITELRTDLLNAKATARRAANDLKRDKIRSDTAHSIKLAQLRNEIELFNSENSDLSSELALSKALLGFQHSVIEREPTSSANSSGKRTPLLRHSRSSSISPRWTLPLAGDAVMKTEKLPLAGDAVMKTEKLPLAGDAVMKTETTLPAPIPEYPE